MIAALLVIGVAGTVARTMQLAARASSAARDVDARADEYEERLRANPWRPAPLRGDSHEGNIYEEFIAAASASDPPSPLFQKMDRACQAASEAELAYLTAHRDEVAALRLAASGDHSVVAFDVRAGRAQELPPVGPPLRALKLLVAASSVAPPAECVAIAADALRLAQAVSPGGLLVSAVISSTFVGLAGRAMLQCLARAEGPAIREALRQLELLHADHPTLGAGHMIEGEQLYRASASRTAVSFDFVLPMTDVQREALWIGGDLLDAQAWCLRELPAARAIGAMEYPEAALRWEEMHEAERRRLGPDNVFISVAEPRRYLVADQQALATVRILTVFAERLVTPSSADIGSLTDPFTGARLRVDATTPDGLRVWSVGADGRNSEGTEDDLVVDQRRPCATTL